MKGRLSAHDFGEDVIGFGCPNKRLGILIMEVDVGVESRNKFENTAENAPTQAVLGKIAEESLHHVEPGKLVGVKWT